MKIYQGQCGCGKVKFSCKGEPLFTQYCHCNKCREIGSQSINSKDKQGYAYTAAYLTHHFQIQAGQESIVEAIRNNAKLLLCGSCHSLVYGISLDPAKQGGIGVNANNIHFGHDVSESFKAVRHIWYENRIVDFDDNLPKFKDAPVEQFGSGELL